MRPGIIIAALIVGLAWFAADWWDYAPARVAATLLTLVFVVRCWEVS